MWALDGNDMRVVSQASCDAAVKSAVEAATAAVKDLRWAYAEALHNPQKDEDLIPMLRAMLGKG
jgi:soluble cytochrome b562